MSGHWQWDQPLKWSSEHPGKHFIPFLYLLSLNLAWAEGFLCHHGTISHPVSPFWYPTTIPPAVVSSLLELWPEGGEGWILTLLPALGPGKFV